MLSVLYWLVTFSLQTSSPENACAHVDNHLFWVFSLLYRSYQPNLMRTYSVPTSETLSYFTACGFSLLWDLVPIQENCISTLEITGSSGSMVSSSLRALWFPFSGMNDVKFILVHISSGHWFKQFTPFIFKFYSYNSSIALCSIQEEKCGIYI